MNHSSYSWQGLWGTQLCSCMLSSSQRGAPIHEKPQLLKAFGFMSHQVSENNML